ncbi:MAG: glycosyltransferase family 39 protein [Alicyclobacillus sp.]|nr:glycosyltransferase family 39 protein [Alicyclobacillus sp.]
MNRRERAGARQTKRPPLWSWQWHHTVLMVILGASAFLNIWDLNQGGFGNAYYAAAVRSMLTSWHNFFYNSFDPAGFITIDKPPVDFWIQALFAWVFGLHGWVLLLPQAIAATVSVLILYLLVQRMFGIVAGLIAAAVLAVTPIAVAVARTNEVDSMLVLVMLLATWALWNAIRTKRLWWLLWVGAIIGIGFNIKMMEAYLILPAVYVTYWVTFNVNWRMRLANLAAMTVVLAAVSFSWAGVVQLTPAQDRPYVGSTQDNNIFSLIFGYNGLERLTGTRGGMGSGFRGNSQGFQFHLNSDGFPQNFRQNRAAGGFRSQGGFPGGFRGEGGFPGGLRGEGGFPGGLRGEGGFPGGFRGEGGFPGGFRGEGGFPGGFRGDFRRQGGFPGGVPRGRGGFMGTGTPGILRLFQPDLSGQISWLLPLALLSCIPLLRGVRWRRRLTQQESGTVFWLAWVLPMAVFFSVAGFFHPYYLVTMAPGIAALVGMGLVQMWRDFHDKIPGWRWFLPVVCAVNLIFECAIVYPYAGLRSALIGGSLVAAVLAGIWIWLAQHQRHSFGQRLWTRAGLVLGVVSLLVAPSYWAMTPLLFGVNESIPTAGPSQSGIGGRNFLSRMGGFAASADEHANSGLEAYLLKHYNAKKGGYLLATTNANTAAPFILDTGLPVMAMGGFTGSDPAVTVEQLASLTKQGKLTYFLIEGNRGFGGADGGFSGRGSQSAVVQWITQHCNVVPPSAYGAATSGSTGPLGGLSGSTEWNMTSRFAMGGGGTLYAYDPAK